VIVDATFLALERDLLREQAQSRSVPFHILDSGARGHLARADFLQRGRTGGDASEAGLNAAASDRNRRTAFRRRTGEDMRSMRRYSMKHEDSARATLGKLNNCHCEERSTRQSRPLVR